MIKYGATMGLLVALLLFAGQSQAEEKEPSAIVEIGGAGDWEVVEPVPAPLRDYSLSPREREVLWWAAQGKSAWEIGEILHIAKRTVDEHTHKAVRKLGAVNRTQAVATALRERLIGKSPPPGKLAASANAESVLDARRKT